MQAHWELRNLQGQATAAEAELARQMDGSALHHGSTYHCLLSMLTTINLATKNLTATRCSRLSDTKHWHATQPIAWPILVLLDGFVRRPSSR